jgi:CheY-like chemotaxis protein/DNA-directed RNA polymerase subunit RPC12/RpoP
MRVETRCAHCGTDYVLDSAFAGTALPCPACGKQDGLLVPEPEVAAAAVATKQATVSPPPPTVDRPSAQPTAAAPVVESRQTEPEEVVCPRCKLHFVPRRATAESAEIERKTVLIVEEMDYFREIAADALSSQFEVKTAATLEDARELLGSGEVDLLVLDLTLNGGVSGVELLRAFSSKPCPILVYADQDESDMYGDSWEELQRLGADDIVMKGMNAGESLARKAASLLDLPWDEDE